MLRSATSGYAINGRPPRWCNTLACAEFMRVPSPAARTMAPTGCGIVKGAEYHHKCGGVKGEPRGPVGRYGPQENHENTKPRKHESESQFTLHLRRGKNLQKSNGLAKVSRNFLSCFRPFVFS